MSALFGDDLPGEGKNPRIKINLIDFASDYFYFFILIKYFRFSMDILIIK